MEGNLQQAPQGFFKSGALAPGSRAFGSAFGNLQEGYSNLVRLVAQRRAQPGVGIRVALEEGWDAAAFSRKARALQDLASRGKLRRIAGKVERGTAATDYKNRLIRRAYGQFGGDTPKFRSMRDRILGMDADHLQDLQLTGLDDASNLWLLNAEVNRGLGRQIWQQIRDLPDGQLINDIIIEGLD